jgi:myo-inositol 2-dehydrogenase / D-chiro-inositol 1-dehydrogenase
MDWMWHARKRNAVTSTGAATGENRCPVRCRCQALGTNWRPLGVTPRYADAAELLAHEELDAIGMAVGPALHVELGVEALSRGLPVFVEKPPAPTADAAERLAGEAARSGKPCIVGFMKRYSTSNRIAGNILRSGFFGSPASIIGQYTTAPTYFVGDPDYTGFLLHHCVHAMDLVPWMMGQPVTDVHVRTHEIKPGKLVLHVGFGFESGALGTVVMGTNQSRGTPMEWWQVMSDHQRLEIRNVHEVRYYRNPAFKVDVPDATLDPQQDTLMWEPNLTAAANEDHKGYHALLSAFLAAAKGEPNDAPTIVDGVMAMRVLEAMMRSMASGQRERPC